MNVLEKTRELGESLYNSEEFQKMKEAQAQMESDSESAQILRELSELEADIRVTMENPEMSELFLQSKMDRYQKMKDLAGQNPLIQQYQEAGNAFQTLMSQVNSIISYYLTGETADDSEGGCGGNCSGCQGCATR
jgi:cell fate (sporulation/competence/biofilm development) regulator YlbF (YheA/YmcA/DUF963 family)